jgi:hypothetical protein
MSTLKVRAKTDSFAALRLLNLQCIAIAAQSANDTEALLNFKVDGLPLAYYLPAIN